MGWSCLGYFVGKKMYGKKGVMILWRVVRVWVRRMMVMVVLGIW